MSSTENLACHSCDSKESKTFKGMEQIHDSSETPRILKMFYYLALCNRAVGFLLTTLVVVWIFQYRGGLFANNFNWHPLFMILGMVLVYSRGILFYRTERTIGMPRLKLMYTRIMIGGILFTVTGLIAGLENNELAESETYQSISYMYTLHGWVGLTSVILFLGQCIADFFSYLYPGINQHQQATNYMQWYLYLAMGSFVGAVTACLLGFNEMLHFISNQGGDYQSENTMIQFIYLTLITFGGLSVYLFSSDCYKRLARPDDDDVLTKSTVFKQLCCIPWSLYECTYSCQMLFSRTHSPPVLATVDTRSPPTLHL